MAEQDTKSDEIGVSVPLDQLQLDAGEKPDRLPPMLFLSALVHGVLIIGITFNAVIGDARRRWGSVSSRVWRLVPAVARGRD